MYPNHAIKCRKVVGVSCFEKQALGQKIPKTMESLESFRRLLNFRAILKR